MPMDTDRHDTPRTAADGRRPNLTAQTASGLRWSYVGTAALMVANLAYTAIISRLLGPVAFGLMALANLVVLFAQYFVRMGIASALVQRPTLSRDEVRAASTAGLAFGAFCFGAVWLLTPLICGLFHQPALSPVLRVLALSFLPEGWSMTGIGLLRREHRFRELSIIMAGTYVLGFLVVGVGLAIAGAGVWSLVAAGMRLSGAHVMDYVGGNLDTLVVGRFTGTAVLGQYSRGYLLVFQPLGWYLSQALTSVLFTSLSRIQQDTARLRKAFLSVLELVAVLLFPLCAGMAVAAPQLVLVVLGSQWTLVAGLVPWFALAGGCAVVSRFSQSVAEARADLNRSMGVHVIYLVVLASCLALALQFRSRGVWVFAAAVAAGEMLRHLGYLALMRRLVGLEASQVVRSYAPAAFASAGVAVTIAAVQRALAGSLPSLLALAAEIAAGALALALCVRFSPIPGIRRELRMRLTVAGALGTVGGMRWRLAPLLLGPHDPAVVPEPRP